MDDHSTLNRRQFLRRASAAALVAPGLPYILAACARNQQTELAVTLGSPNAPKPLPVYDDNQAIGGGLPQEPGPLRLLTLPDYLPGSLIKGFEKEYGVTVEEVTFASPDEGLRKVASGKVPFDVYVALVDQLPSLVGGKLVAPLNHEHIPNLTNIWDTLQDPWYDPGSIYTVASVVGSFGIDWRTDMFDVDVAALANPWDAMWDPAAKDIVGFYDQFREAIAFSLFRNGEKDPNDPSDEALSAAVEGLVNLINVNGARVTSDCGYVGLGEGRFGISHAFAGDAQYAQFSLPEGGDPSVFRFVWPPAATAGAVGGTVSSDMWAVGRSAESPVLAHLWINYISGAEQAKAWYAAWGLQLPQKTLTPDRLVSEGIVPEYLVSQILTPEDFDLGQWILPLSQAKQQRLIDAWTQVQRSG